MKTLIWLLLLNAPLLLFGQITPADTARIGALSRSTTSLAQSVSALTARTDTLTRKIDGVLKPVDCAFCQPDLKGGQLLVAMPLLLFALASFYVLVRLRQEGYKLSDALKENYTVEIPQTSPEGAEAKAEAMATLKEGDKSSPGMDKTTTVEIRPQSTSRLIAFFAGMAAIIISVSAVSYFFYVYLRTGKEPQFESLWNVVLGLGVGVVPYAFARISDALNPPATKKS